MSEKRFRANFDVSIYDSETEEYISASERGLEEIAKRMNEQQTTINELKEEMVRLHKMSIELMDRVIPNLRRENEQLRTQLLICQQSKNDDGQFKVWQVPPIRIGMRVSTTTIDDEQKTDSKRWRWSE